MRPIPPFPVLGFTVFFLVALPFSALSACDETPRGEQGIDFLEDGSYYNVPPAPEAGPDAHGPCGEEADAGPCSDVSEGGVPFNHFIECAGASPFGIQCLPNSGAADAGVSTYCCSTGVI